MSEHMARHLQLLEESDLFDRAWYLARYPDVAETGLSAEEHYLRIGARLLRDPGPGFSTRHYVGGNHDVRSAGVNPLVHYLQHGRRERREPYPKALSVDDLSASVDVIVPVFNALSDVKRCLESVVRFHEGLTLTVIVVNDGSDADTTQWLREFSGDHEAVRLVENAENIGYTRSVNVGLRRSTADYVVTLNSDCVVTSGWLKGMIRCTTSDPRIGIVGPMSNAASWQNVPTLMAEDGQFAVNDTCGMPIEEMARVVCLASRRRYPRVPFVNGFCFMIDRRVVDVIGYMDEERFPLGYGEENDYCIRAADAGFSLAIADDVYVFHAKSKSFGHERRKELSRAGSEMLKEKHTHAKYAALVAGMRQTPALDAIRRDVIQMTSDLARSEVPVEPTSLRILFLLPVNGGGGGAHSVVQEVNEMRRMGIHACIGVAADRVDSFISQYPEMPESARMFVGFTPSSLIEVASGFDIVIGTIYSSMKMVADVVRKFPHIMAGYYVQDYEPLFFQQGSSRWSEAHESYGLVPGACLFAKTAWIIQRVRSEHDVDVSRVLPSIDHEVYLPRARVKGRRQRVVAMIRPQTPVRGAARTMRVLKRIGDLFGEQVDFDLFGCEESHAAFQDLEKGFAYRNHGPLRRAGVASLLQEGDVFIDLSDYQAFGRTSLEAMACGCVAVVPAQGGGDEYALDGVNSLVVDVTDEDACVERIAGLLRDPGKIAEMRVSALATAARYSVHSAAVSEIGMLTKAYARHRRFFGNAERNQVFILPSIREDGAPTGSAYVRVLLPYRSTLVSRRWRSVVGAHLPEPGSSGVALIQREARHASLQELQAWLPPWRAAGGKLVYEIDDDLVNEDALRSRGFEASHDLGELSAKVKWLAAQADTVVVSTEKLASDLQHLARRIRIVPNRLDPDLWRLNQVRDHSQGPFARSEDVVRIGYIGTPTHTEDLRMIAGAMKDLKRDLGDRVQIEIIGAFQNVPPLFGGRVALPKSTEYPNFVNWLHQRVHWDIGIIPLKNDHFNDRKSNLKFLEYSALDMASVCSDVPTYSDVVEDGVNGLMAANTEEAWYAAVRRLVEDAPLRARLASSARRKVASDHTFDSGLDDYLGVLQE